MKYPQVRMLVYYLIGLFSMGLAAWLMSGAFPIGPALVGIHWFVALLPAILLSVIAITVCCVAGKNGPEQALSFSARRALYRVCYLLNAVASGLAVGALVAEKGMVLTSELLAALIPALALGIMLCLLFFIPNRTWRKIVSILFVLLAAALVIAGLICRARVSAPMGYTAVFSGLFFLLFPLGNYFAAKNPNHWYRYLAYTGFGAFAVILFVVILILSEGEILDGLDFDLGSGGGGNSKKKQPK